MALAFLESQIEEVRAKAESAHASHESRRREIDRDPTYSESYKQQLHSENVERTRANLSAFRAQEDQLIDNRVKELERTLDSAMGNTAADIIAFRDAQDRAERLTERDEAERVLARALRNDDKSLAHAVFRRALDAGWTTVIDQFTRDNPTITDTVSDLRRLKSAQQMESMQRTMRYSMWGLR